MNRDRARRARSLKPPGSAPGPGLWSRCRAMLRIWSTRSLARQCGLSRSTVSRIWRALALQPHRSETFKLSKDPLFIEKVRDIVGLYPESARSGTGVVCR